MCGRYNIITDAQALYAAFQVEVTLEGGGLARYNVAPGTDQLVVCAQEGRRAANWYRWGLIPFWAKDASIAYKTVNARAETVATKPAFRAALRQRRCLVPASAYYEWKQTERGKQPYLIRVDGGALFAFAGLWESWKAPEGELRTFCLITTEPNAYMARIHDRMPAIVAREHYAAWLDPKLQDPQSVQRMIGSYPGRSLAAYPVSARVNSARNQGPELIEPVGPVLA